MTITKNVTVQEVLNSLEVNGGATLKNFNLVTYKSGYQVATEGKKCRTKLEALVEIFYYGGDCGIWYDGEYYYIDRSHRESTKTKALLIGKQCKQISILKWSDMSLIYC